jgi:hypothetical protein
MSRRKGEVTKQMIDRDYPHQVELPQPARGFGTRLNELHHLAHSLGPHAQRSVVAYPYEGSRWCFRTAEDADVFLGLLHPSDQGKRVTVEPKRRGWP